MKTFIKISVCLLLAASMLFSAASCAMKISAQELSKDYTRKASSTGSVTEEFKAAMANFSMELFKGTITKDTENDLISPLSAVICLAMIANGAEGETKAQMEAAFGLEISELNESLYAYTSSLYSDKNCKVSIADSIWFRDNGRLKVNEEFLQTNADWYNAQIYAAPFDDSTLKDINNWCRKYTDGMIDEILDKIEEDSVMFLINALLFDAKWSEKYEKDDVKSGKFNNYDGKKVDVEFLKSEEKTYLKADGVTGFAKNYAGDKYSIVGLLPDEGTDIYEYVASLTGEKWLGLWNNKTNTLVNVRMPEFTYSAKMKLNEVLESMGMTDMFDGGRADFTKLGSSFVGNIYCSSVEQKVFIEVNRNGTKAAAITWGEMKSESAVMCEYVNLDRPFVYAIVDNATGLPLFIGAVTNLG